jgi:hypothetical protein
MGLTGMKEAKKNGNTQHSCSRALTDNHNLIGKALWVSPRNRSYGTYFFFAAAFFAGAFAAAFFAGAFFVVAILSPPPFILPESGPPGAE